MPLATTCNEPIPGYKIQKRIGAGGYGEVWSVEAPGGLEKAIKFVYGYLDEERASRELKALNRIKTVRHPFLVSLERIEVVEGQLVIITELADRSLKDRYEQCVKEGLRGIPQDELLKYVRDAADALDYMSESHSLQHLDVKPENLLLVGKHVKVADFGLVKELHDVTGSLMGGLTPLYAPPESFDGRPSRHSDQYSLAVLYQEMLTGVLPFPGATAAQLAAQHLHSKPRVAPLPPAQQPVILKALSKDPKDRFESCAELVESLQLASRGESSFAPGEMAANSTASVPRATEVVDLVDGGPQGQAESNQPLATSVMSDVGRVRPKSASGPKKMGWSIPTVSENPTAETPPPDKLDDEQFALRPTLFVGIGGTGARILAHLSQRLHERFGGQPIPTFRSLLLETDGGSAMQVAHGSTGNFDSQHVLLMPLRRPQDYRSAPKSLIETMSRRWIYNIPRSQQTEGIRPLGRLAFLDHAEKVVARLREDLAAIVGGEALDLTRQSTQQTVDSSAPRVVLVSSISGGAGGGMLMDVAYAARQVLDELNLPAEHLSALLCHSTPRSQGAKDLAVANAYACLSELQFFSRRDREFPGTTTHVKPLPADQECFRSINFMHLGEDLSPTQFEAGVMRAAEFLYLESVTACGDLLAQRASQGRPTGEPWNVCANSLDLFQLGDALEETLNNVAQHLCGRVIQRWRGRNETEKRGALGVTAAPAAVETDGTSLHGEATQMAGQKMAQLRLDHDAMMSLCLESLHTVLRAEPQQRFQQLRDELVARGKQDPSADDMIAAVDALLGPRAAEPMQSDELDESIRRGLDQYVGERAAGFGSELSEWVLQLLDRPTTRLKGAEQAADWIKTYLRDIRDKLCESEQQLYTELAGVLLANSSPDQKDKPKSKSRTAKTAESAGDPTEDLAWRYFELRLQKIATSETKRLTQRLLIHVGGAADQLRDLEREFSNLERQFDDHYVFDDFEELSPKDEDDLARVRRGLREHLRQSVESLVGQLDAAYCSEFFQPFGGMQCLVSGDTEIRSSAPPTLLAASRRILKQAQSEVDISQLLLPPDLEADRTGEMLRRIVDSSSPQLNQCGGQHRLTVVLPQQTSRERVEALLEEHCQRRASFVSDTDCDLVMLTTFDHVSLAQIAVRLIDERADYAEAASRLYSRCDVQWTPWDDVQA